MSDSLEQRRFKAFNPQEPVHVYHRNLPHWRQDGSTYFVTFRAGDSIPKPILLQWMEEDRLWLKARGVEMNGAPRNLEGLREHCFTEIPEKLQEEFFRRTARRMHVELDQCHGRCLFRKAELREVLAHALDYFDNDRWWLGDYVIMPNHVHLLAQPVCEKNDPENRSTELEDILGSIKGYVSTQLTKLGVKNGKLWQQDNYDRLVRDSKELYVWRRYIRRNPEKAGLCEGLFTYFECDWM